MEKRRFKMEVVVEMESHEGGPEPTELDAIIAVSHALQIAKTDWDCTQTGAKSELVDYHVIPAMSAR